jgi:hypothetical protein
VPPMRRTYTSSMDLSSEQRKTVLTPTSDVELRLLPSERAEERKIVMPSSGGTVITVALLLAALGLKVTDFVKYLVALGRTSQRTDAANGIVTTLLSSVVGFLVVQFLVKPSAWGDEVKIGDEKLSDLGLGSTIVFGLVFTALASTLYDFKKAVDGQDDAVKPKLIV